MPLMAVHGPKPMSLCHKSPTFLGSSSGFLFLRFDRIDAVDPGSIFGLVSDSNFDLLLQIVFK